MNKIIIVINILLLFVIASCRTSQNFSKIKNSESTYEIYSCTNSSGTITFKPETSSVEFISLLNGPGFNDQNISFESKFLETFPPKTKMIIYKNNAVIGGWTKTEGIEKFKAVYNNQAYSNCKER